MNSDFEQWWKKHGQFCRSGGGEYEKTFAFRAWEAATNRAATKRAPKPRELSPVGTGALLGEQQFCFEKGWKEGISALRKMLRSNGEVRGASVTAQPACEASSREAATSTVVLETNGGNK